MNRFPDHIEVVEFMFTDTPWSVWNKTSGEILGEGATREEAEAEAKKQLEACPQAAAIY